MPTKVGNVWAQFIDWRFANNGIITYEVRPNNRSVTVQSALTFIETTKAHWAETGISRIISSSGVEQFPGKAKPATSRTGVTLVEFRTAASGCEVRACHTITYWN